MRISDLLMASICALSLFACGEEAAPDPEPASGDQVAEPAPEPAEEETVSVGTMPPPAEDDIASATATGELARSILAEPTRAEALLGEAGLTADTFEARVYDIARDPVLSRAYRAALEPEASE